MVRGAAAVRRSASVVPELSGLPGGGEVTGPLLRVSKSEDRGESLIAATWPQGMRQSWGGPASGSLPSLAVMCMTGHKKEEQRPVLELSPQAWRQT